MANFWKKRKRRSKPYIAVVRAYKDGERWAEHWCVDELEILDSETRLKKAGYGVRTEKLEEEK